MFGNSGNDKVNEDLDSEKVGRHTQEWVQGLVNKRQIWLINHNRSADLHTPIHPPVISLLLQ